MYASGVQVKRTTVDGWYATSDGRLWSDKRLRYIGETATDGSGYLVTSTRINGKTTKLEVHSLICEAYHGPRPEGYQCNHKDLDKTNNHPDNLEWVSQADNMKHAWANGVHERSYVNGD